MFLKWKNLKIYNLNVLKLPIKNLYITCGHMCNRSIKVRSITEGHTSISKKWLSSGKEETEWDWEGVQKGCQMSLILLF